MFSYEIMKFNGSKRRAFYRAADVTVVLFVRLHLTLRRRQRSRHLLNRRNRCTRRRSWRVMRRHCGRPRPRRACLPSPSLRRRHLRAPGRPIAAGRQPARRRRPPLHRTSFRPVYRGPRRSLRPDPVPPPLEVPPRRPSSGLQTLRKKFPSRFTLPLTTGGQSKAGASSTVVRTPAPPPPSKAAAKSNKSKQSVVTETVSKIIVSRLRLLQTEITRIHRYKKCRSLLLFKFNLFKLLSLLGDFADKQFHLLRSMLHSVVCISLCLSRSCIVLKWQMLLIRFLLNMTVPCLSQIVLNFGLHRSTPSSPNFAPKRSISVDLGVGDIWLQIVPMFRDSTMVTRESL